MPTNANPSESGSTRPKALRLTLFQRDECPLCDEADGVLAQAGIPDFDPLWIDGDVGLEAIYGTRVPVLRREDNGAELDWPFDAAAVRAFISRGRAAAGS